MKHLSLPGGLLAWSYFIKLPFCPCSHSSSEPTHPMGKPTPAQPTHRLQGHPNPHGIKTFPVSCTKGRVLQTQPLRKHTVFSQSGLPNTSLSCQGMKEIPSVPAGKSTLGYWRGLTVGDAGTQLGDAQAGGIGKVHASTAKRSEGLGRTPWGLTGDGCFFHGLQ